MRRHSRRWRGSQRDPRRREAGAALLRSGIEKTSFNGPSGEAGKEVGMAVPEERGGRVAPEDRAARSSAAEYSQRHDPEWVRAGRELLSAPDVGRTIARMAHQIIEKTAL